MRLGVEGLDSAEQRMLWGDWFVCTTVHLFLHEQMSSKAEQALESGCLGSHLGSVLWEIL